MPEDSPPPATVFSSWPGCAGAVPDVELGENNDRAEQGGVPDGFTPVVMVSCESGSGPEDSMVAVERRTTDVAGLLVEVDRRGERVASGTISCTADLWLRPWWFLLDAQGRWMMPQVPVDACDHPFLSLAAARASMRWTEVDRRTLDRERVVALPNGCPRRASSSLLLIQGREEPRGREVVLPDLGRKGSICRYDLAPATNPQITPEGHYRSARPLASVPMSGLGLERFRGRCREQPSGFVQILTPDGTPSTVIELDGCRRVIVGTDTGYVAAQASPELLGLLAG